MLDSSKINAEYYNFKKRIVFFCFVSIYGVVGGAEWLLLQSAGALSDFSSADVGG